METLSRRRSTDPVADEVSVNFNVDSAVLAIKVKVSAGPYPGELGALETMDSRTKPVRDVICANMDRRPLPDPILPRLKRTV